jgi:membrane-bound lytic murein transglycosylase F
MLLPMLALAPMLLVIGLPDAHRIESKTAAKGAGAGVELEWELTRHTRERYVGDLDEIKKRGVLRVLTRNNSSAYFIARGEQRGFQFELCRELAKELGVRLAVVVPASRDDLISALLAGGGDLIGAGMTVTASRSLQVRFTSPIISSPRVVVTHPLTVKQLIKMEDLLQFTIHINPNSTTRSTADMLAQRLGQPLTIKDITQGIEMEEMLEKVASGEYEATIVDKDLYELELAAGVPVLARLDAGEPLPKAWALRPDSPQLFAAAEAFVTKHLKDGLIRILYQRYYLPSPRSTSTHQSEFRADAAGKISPWDEIFQREGKANNVDWRLLAAVARTESHFVPEAKSPWGAVGLMQILPRTAAELGVTKVEEIPENIRAGARYLRRLIDAFAESGLEQRQQVRFAIASYNVGLGHIQDARTIAPQIGLDRNVWFKNVEEALRLKKLPKWHEKSRFGYCRADEPIQYVSDVQTWYDVYVRYLPSR